MTLSEAANTGKRIRRPGSPWITPSDGSEGIFCRWTDVMADDWTVEPGVITRTQFDEAWARIWPGTPGRHLRDLVAKELGL